MKKLLISLTCLMLVSPFALARNTPCSGQGGVAQCNGDKFVCVDGSTSKSKKVCTADKVAKIKKHQAKHDAKKAKHHAKKTTEATAK